MSSQSVAQPVTSVRTHGDAAVRHTPPAPLELRRPGSLSTSERELRQPQDGAPEPPPVVTLTSRWNNSLAAEPEDARLTGGTRSLMRRVLGLNVLHSLRKNAAVTPKPLVQPNVA